MIYNYFIFYFIFFTLKIKNKNLGEEMNLATAKQISETFYNALNKIKTIS
jgi:hypothetical protein